MTTFTLQDLTINNLPTTPEEDEMFKTMAEMSRQTGELLPKSQVNPEAVIDEMLYSIKQSLLLLATVIKEQPNTTPPEGNPPSLQETLSLTLQQADWFRDLVEEVIEERLDDYDFDDAVKGAVNNVIDEAVSDKLDNASISIRF
jgi:hypothetical protein